MRLTVAWWLDANYWYIRKMSVLEFVHLQIFPYGNYTLHFITIHYIILYRMNFVSDGNAKEKKRLDLCLDLATLYGEIMEV